MNYLQKQQNEITLKNEMTSARKYIAASKAPNTIKAYRSDWKYFVAWCEKRKVNPMPAAPETVAVYIAFLADQGRKAATIQRKITAISQAHIAAGFDSPTKTAEVRTTWQGIRRLLGTAPKQKKAASVDILKAILEPIGDHKLLDVRNRALLLIGWNGGLRRSELANLDLDDIEFSDEGLALLIRRSKTDQDGLGRRIGIPFGRNAKTCPVRALQKWIQAAGIREGALFRSVNRHGRVQTKRLTGDGVAYIIKEACERAGFDKKEFAGHSLRRGFITTAAKKGKSEASIMRQTGHKSIQIMRRYIEEANIFENNAADGLGL